MSDEFDIEKVRRDNSILRKFAAIQRASSDLVSVQKVYIDMTGNLEAAFVLDELIYFTLPRGDGKSGLRIWKEGMQWMAVQRADWWERKRITPRQADTAIAKLIEAGLVIKRIFKFNGQPTTHLRLNVDKFFAVYADVLAKHNPPEDENDTLTAEINDLYAMMDLPPIDPRNNALVTSKSPKRETKSQNGDLINNPHTTLTNNPKDMVRAKSARTATPKPPMRLTIPPPVVPLYRKWVELFGQEPVDYAQAMLWIHGSKKKNTLGLEYIAASGATPEDLEWAWNRCKKDGIPVAIPSTLVTAAVGHHKQFGSRAGTGDAIKRDQAARRAEVERMQGKSLMEEE